MDRNTWLTQYGLALSAQEIERLRPTDPDKSRSAWDRQLTDAEEREFVKGLQKQRNEDRTKRAKEVREAPNAPDAMKMSKEEFERAQRKLISDLV